MSRAPDEPIRSQFVLGLFNAAGDGIALGGTRRELLTYPQIWPLCELNPGTMTTTPCVFPSGCHDRVKIFNPPTPSKVDSFIS